MRSLIHAGTIVLVLLAAGVRPAAAQQPMPPDSLRATLARLAARLDTLEQGGCPAGAPLVAPAGADSVSRSLAALTRRLEQLVAARCAPAAAAPAPADAGDELAALRAAAAAAAGGAADAAPSAARDTAPAQPVVFIGKQRSGSALNPEISATGDLRLVTRTHGDAFEGDPHEFELALQSALDPYANAKIFLTFSPGEIGVEEGYLYYTGLPGHLRADVGLVRQQVGDLNRWHLHALPETDYPLVYRRFLGPDGLSGAGLSLYTPLPLSLAGGTHELWVQATTAESDPLYLGARRPTLLGRLQNFWQLSRSTYGQVGFTALGGNADTLHSRVLGVDARLTWRPPNAGTRSEVTLRAEGYRLRSTVPGVQDNRYGAFAGLTWRASQRWVLGTRYDYVELPGTGTGAEWQLTPTLTWWESEFVYLRLEGQHHHDPIRGNRDRLLFQAVFAMGPHKHETY